jgi:hypothetical protein
VDMDMSSSSWEYMTEKECPSAKTGLFVNL